MYLYNYYDVAIFVLRATPQEDCPHTLTLKATAVGGQQYCAQHGLAMTTSIAIPCACALLDICTEA